MATNFPASLDTLTNPTSSDSLNSPSHSAQHANSNDAIEALQAKVGVDSSAVTTSLDYRVGQLETGGGGMTVSSTAPSSPAEGDMWYDDTSGRTYVYYDDGSSQQWVEFGAPPSGIGKILQVVSTTKTDTFSASVTGGTTSAITGLTATITPTSATSKVFVLATLYGASAGGHFLNAIITRGGTSISIGDTAGSRTSITGGFNVGYSATVGSANFGTTTLSTLDSPATTSSTTYGVSLTTGGTQTFYVNRSNGDADDAARMRMASTITVMEVSA